MADDEQAHCRVCYKPLPPLWFDTCAMCVYEARVKGAQRRHYRRPSYRSPLSTLDRLNGNK